jgi:hypothetical protein
MCNLILHLKSGSSVSASCDDDEYDSIYDMWHDKKDGVMAFNNCCVHAVDVELIEYAKETK